MIAVILFFLAVSVLFYVLFAGADYGAGILELFTKSKHADSTRRITYRAIGPIWEANHIWLILVVVILFTGFPEIYQLMSIHLHLPILALLIGIIMRGTAFIFRHYDAVQDHLQKYYNLIFVYSSTITPFFLGVIAGSLYSGHFPEETGSFFTMYIRPWVNGFSILTGLLCVALCSFLASVFLVGEAQSIMDQKRFIKTAKLSSIASVTVGILLILYGVFVENPATLAIIKNPISMSMIAGAVVCYIIFRKNLKKEKYILIRTLTGTQISLIIGSWLYATFPVVIYTPTSGVDLFEVIAPERTIELLMIALLVGSLFILPALFWLLKSFGLIKYLNPGKSR